MNCTNDFKGLLSARGAPGANNGSAGTIYSSGANRNAQLLVDNGGLIATNTIVTLPGSYDLTIGGKSVVSFSGGSIGPFGSLLIESNSWLNAGEVHVVA